MERLHQSLPALLDVFQRLLFYRAVTADVHVGLDVLEDDAVVRCGETLEHARDVFFEVLDQAAFHAPLGRAPE